jgi:hypothetical protein
MDLDDEEPDRRGAAAAPSAGAFDVSAVHSTGFSYFNYFNYFDNVRFRDDSDFSATLCNFAHTLI